MDNKLKEIHADFIDYAVKHVITTLSIIPLADWIAALTETRHEWETLSANMLLDGTEYKREIRKLKRKKDLLEGLVDLRELCKES